MGDARRRHVIGSGPAGRRGRRHPRRLAAAAAVTAAAAPLIAAPSAASAPFADAGAQVPVLTWHPCPGPRTRGFQCATAHVPLDYTAPTGATIEIAVIRHRATGPGSRIGSVFFNPGGPGGSGVSALPAIYPLFPAGLRQHFDIVSFDPRGVGQSTAVQCFPTAAQDSRFLAALPQGFPVGTAQTRRWIRGFTRLGRLCEQRGAGLLPHLGTADAARDMDLLRQAVGDPALNYLGISYGTYLGATYANLFPGNVRAMVLDAAVAPTAWARQRQAGRVPLGTFLRVGMDSGQKATLRQFLDLCGRAGIRHCAFSAGTPRATRARYATLLRRLRRHPVRIASPGQGLVTTTYGSLVSLVANDLYTVRAPGGRSTGWTLLARILRAAWRASGGGGHRPTAGPAGTPSWPAPVSPVTPTPAASAAAGLAAHSYSGSEQQFAILCADSPNPRDPASYRAQAAFGYARSGAFGNFVAWLTEVCATWPATDANGYYGPWNRWTSSPILVVGNTFDPATPYQDSLIMTRELARARLLTLAGYGHTALTNPSACVNSYETSYFLTGALPPAGTVCQQDHQPFG
jgi:pimeloyl-ACP methyl ester carboxylesterase